jgi:hypothetical protein
MHVRPVMIRGRNPSNPTHAHVDPAACLAIANDSTMPTVVSLPAYVVSALM